MLLSSGLGALVLALMQGQSWGWDSAAILGLFAAFAVITPIFVWWELRSAEPLVRLELFGRGNFAIDNAILAGVQFALVGVSVFGAIWVQTVLGYGPIQAGLSLLPLTLPLLVAAPLAGRFFDRFGPRVPLATGTFLLALSLAWNAQGLHHHSYIWLVPGYIGMGIALGLAISPSTTDAMNAAHPWERSQASGLTQMMRQVGGAVGLAVMGAVVARTEHHEIAQNGTSPDALHDAITKANQHAYWVAAAVMLVVAIAAVALVRTRVAMDDQPAAAVLPASANASAMSS